MGTVDLLKPRVRVENKYPHCPYEVDEILYEHEYGNGNKYFALKDGALPLDVKDAKDFPYIFRPLDWWEGRSKSHCEKPGIFPEYIKSKSTGNVYKINYYKLNEFSEGLALDIDTRWRVLSDMMPSTHAEYLAYTTPK